MSAAATAGWLALAVVGCGAPDRSAQVRQLRDEIGKMPGVQSVDPGVGRHGVEEGRITQLSVYASDLAMAYRDLKSVIATLTPTKTLPLELDWSRMVETDNFHRFAGSVELPN